MNNIQISYWINTSFIMSDINIVKYGFNRYNYCFLAQIYKIMMKVRLESEIKNENENENG